MYAQWKSQLAIATLGAILVLSLGACEAGVLGPQGEAVSGDQEGQTLRDDGIQFGGLDGLQRLQSFRELTRTDEEEEVRSAGPRPLSGAPVVR